MKRALLLILASMLTFSIAALAFTGTTEQVSLSDQGRGGYAPSISADGRFAAFASGFALVKQDKNGFSDVYLKDRVDGTVWLVSGGLKGSGGDRPSENSTLSSDGRLVAFTSDASDLVEGDLSGFTDVFVWDRATGQTERVSFSRTGLEGNGASQSPAISGDGRFVAYCSSDW